MAEQRTAEIWYNTREVMRVYLDNCCYNRPFDEQGDVRVVLETFAKLIIQTQMRTGVIEYVWSNVLDYEIDQSKMIDRTKMIRPWKRGAAVYVRVDEEIRIRANEFQAKGIKPFDSLHLACAERAECDWFFTVDKGILKKLSEVGNMRVANRLSIMEGEMKAMTDSELKCTCYGILSAKIGDVDTERFIALVNRDAFDYTQWRKHNLGVGETVDSLYDKICEYSATHEDAEIAMA